MLSNFFLKIIDKKKYQEKKNKIRSNDNLNFYNIHIKKRIEKFSNVIKEKNELNFLHSGHLGDLIYSLPLIKELSKTKKCNFYIEINKKNTVEYHKHPSGNVFINKKTFDLLLPLIEAQQYINDVKIFEKEKTKIDIDLNFFREMPFNIIFHSMRWYSHLTGIPINMEEKFLETNLIDDFRDKISIMRSPRYRNEYINYKFLSSAKNLVFLGLYEEFKDLKEEIKNLEFHNCKDFLEMAMIINSSRFFIGNLCFAYSVAEGLKKPRLLETCPNFPVVFPIGKNAYDFYHQLHFEKYFDILNSR